jgi:hypothetical protein
MVFVSEDQKGIKGRRETTRKKRGRGMGCKGFISSD